MFCWSRGGSHGIINTHLLLSSKTSTNYALCMRTYQILLLAVVGAIGIDDAAITHVVVTAAAVAIAGGKIDANLFAPVKGKGL